MYKIDKKIPAPGSSKDYPFEKLEVGHSFLVPVEESQDARNAAHTFKKATGWNFKTKSVEGGVRVWRIE
ncbi:MAG: hypothetical protein V3W52_17055 [Syntrophobacteria bacterium]